jgi:two-component system CheB/CheR fusion protein
MYFNAPAQARILARLHFALADGGYLLLGRAETLLSHNATFRPVDLRLRVFTKTHTRSVLEPTFMMRTDAEPPTWSGVLHDDVRDAAFNGTGVAHMVVDREGGLIMANDLARSLFQISPRDLNRPFYELEVSYKPVELRSLIEQAYFEQRIIAVTGVEFRRRDQESWLETKVIPLMRRNGEIAGVSIVFTDVTVNKRIQSALERANFELQTSYEQLQSAHEEMETTNEELQSTVEELETTNEELQATNEELETMNEELQSTNEELQAVNDLARVYNGELDSVNHFMQSILSGLGHRVMVIDSAKNVILWNSGADELWGVRADDAMNQPLSSLEIGLPVHELDDDLQDILDGKKDRIDRTVPSTTRRGKPVECEVSMVPLLSRDGSAVTGVIILTDNVTSDGVPEAIPRLRRV